MAVLRAQDSGREFILPDRSLVGRSRACDVTLMARDVSGQHAVLQWTDACWELHDLGSRNGTHVDGVKLAPGARINLRAGAVIGFGAEAPPFELVDASAPQLMAVHLTSGTCRIADAGYLSLPDPQDPELCVYYDPQGRWLSERHGEAAAIDDRAVVTVGAGELWRVYLPRACASTWAGDGLLQLAQLRLRFAFSRDEEHVELSTLHGERRLDLQVRAHNYLLLLLARRRLADARAGLPAAEQGWIRQSELLRMLRMDDNHLNISIHRARTQLARLGVTDAAALFERRPRQLRIGAAELELAPLHEPDPA
jgi:hypothetical protein